MKKTLQTLRNNIGLSQSQASKILEITPQYLAMLERGARNPSDNLKVAMANLYKCTINDIFLAMIETKCFTERKKDGNKN